jgi:hypothetical protein
MAWTWRVQRNLKLRWNRKNLRLTPRQESTYLKSWMIFQRRILSHQKTCFSCASWIRWLRVKTWRLSSLVLEKSYLVRWSGTGSLETLCNMHSSSSRPKTSAYLRIHGWMAYWSMSAELKLTLVILWPRCGMCIGDVSFKSKCKLWLLRNQNPTILTSKSDLKKIVEGVHHQTVTVIQVQDGDPDLARRKDLTDIL